MERFKCPAEGFLSSYHPKLNTGVNLKLKALSEIVNIDRGGGFANPRVKGMQSVRQKRVFLELEGKLRLIKTGLGKHASRLYNL